MSPVNPKLCKTAAIIARFLRTHGGAITLKFGIVACPREAAGNSLPVYGAAVFAVSVARADELAGEPVFDGVFQPKLGGFGKVTRL